MATIDTEYRGYSIRIYETGAAELFQISGEFIGLEFDTAIEAQQYVDKIHA